MLQQFGKFQAGKTQFIPVTLLAGNENESEEKIEQPSEAKLANNTNVAIELMAIEVVSAEMLVSGGFVLMARLQLMLLISRLISFTVPHRESVNVAMISHTDRHCSP